MVEELRNKNENQQLRRKSHEEEKITLGLHYREGISPSNGLMGVNKLEICFEGTSKIKIPVSH